ncbi:MAG: glycosyltransferase family 2 protein [Lentisphaeria bacterium]|nr:glycosyltransferase family 2 protein [Lentisphaeria bacterium]
MPQITVLLNNYNYGRFLAEAVRSVIEQDFDDLELLIVDDGSTDDSRQIISSFNDPRIRSIFKENGGQLSAFNTGVLESTGEVISFLDADDVFMPGYLKRVWEEFEKNKDCGFLMTRLEFFGNKTGFASAWPEGKIGSNPFSVAARHLWIGMGTSACSVRRDVLLKFLPWCDGEYQWKTRADDLLVWGGDLAGAVKYSIHEPHVKYRIHGSNLFYGEKTPAETEVQERRDAAERFCGAVVEKNKLSYADMLKTELKHGSVSRGETLRSWLKLGYRRKMRFFEYLKCGMLILAGIKFRSSIKRIMHDPQENMSMAVEKRSKK